MEGERGIRSLLASVNTWLISGGGDSKKRRITNSKINCVQDFLVLGFKTRRISRSFNFKSKVKKIYF